MADKPFDFKEFRIRQDQCAMKIGTDGVLLGAWSAIPEGTESILDIGTGTGLLALQMAQRSAAETIDALEIENKAFEQAVENFENSPWADRLFCYHASLQEFTNEMEQQYDLIISNPPYFNDTYKDLMEERALARHTKKLSYPELLNASKNLLTAKGQAAFIIPYQEETAFLTLAASTGLFPLRITRVRGRAESKLKRSLLQLSKEAGTTVIEELVIEHNRHDYTDAYTALVKDFYLNM